MRDSCTTLYPNDHVGRKVSQYADKNSLKLPVPIEEYHAKVLETHEKSNFMISTLEAKYLTWLAKTHQAKRVLEIGVYVGFSVMIWADAVGADGLVTGLEVSSDYAARAQEQLECRGYHNTEIIVGDALQTLASLEPSEPYDLIFIDANKGAYPAYLTTILDRSLPNAACRLLKKNGLIIADNILRSALVVERGEKNPASETVPKQTENWNEGDVDRLDLFNRMANADDSRLETFLMPLFDGLGHSRLLD